MTEEIIKCKYFVKEYEDFTNVCELGVIGKDDSFMACEYNPNCYYKQFKQAENTVNECHKYLAELEDKIDRLEQENKELKEENKTLNYQWHKQSEIGDEWYKIAERYRSALEEIKDLVKEISYLGSRGGRELKFKIKNILEDVIDDEIY